MAKTVEYTCDFCKQTITPGDVQAVIINGVQRDLDSECLKAIQSLLEDRAALEVAREASRKLEAAEAELVAK